MNKYFRGISFRIKGEDDFRQKLLERESVWVSCNKYVFEKGETALVKISGGQMVKGCMLKKNDVTIPMKNKEQHGMLK
ncbi:hypothetical protein NXX56_23160 [Bacteroides thetaiotaomicron]|nr:hypothetical protein [Bacteroides thetaiotaomicron]